MEVSSRRTFIRTLGLLPAAVMVAACGGAASPTARPAATTAAAPTTAPAPTQAPAATAPPTAAATKPAAAAASPAAASPVAPNQAPPAATKPAASGGATPVVASTAAASAASGQVAVPSCVLTPALTEGPYFVDEKLNRSDIRTDPANGAVKAGLPLALAVRVLGVSGNNCAPIAGAQVDLWQCDAEGVYSDASDPSFNTRGQKFLRGYQLTDASGVAKFTTIYPGWYRGRATHIHFKVRTDPSTERGKELTSQFFIDDALNSQVYTSAAPYSARGDRGRTTNNQDGIYRDGGSKLLLQMTKSGDGYNATFDVGVKLT